MSSIDSITEAVHHLSRGLEEGRLAHAYLLVGAPRGDALALAEAVLHMLLDPARGAGPADVRSHPDVVWIEPESKSRVIVIDQVRELNHRMHRTSYVGGWKAGVILYADRMNDSAANAFLKTLEEPPSKTILLLLTDETQKLLPTIISRCQRVILSSDKLVDISSWRERLLEVLREGLPRDSLGVFRYADRLKALFDDVKQEITKKEKPLEEDAAETDKAVLEARISARLIEVRTEIMRLILLWQRDVLIASLDVESGILHFQDEADRIRRQAAEVSRSQALRRIRLVEDIQRRLERHVPVNTAVEASFFDALAC